VGQCVPVDPFGAVISHLCVTFRSPFDIASPLVEIRGRQPAVLVAIIIIAVTAATKTSTNTWNTNRKRPTQRKAPDAATLAILSRSLPARMRICRLLSVGVVGGVVVADLGQWRTRQRCSRP
jgi:hypothetical protein